MSVAEATFLKPVRLPSGPKLRLFLIVSILLHFLLFLYLSLDGLFEGNDAEDEAVTVELAAGPGEDTYATQDLDQINDRAPSFTQSDYEPVPVPQPPQEIVEPTPVVPKVQPVPRPEIPVRKAEKPKPEPQPKKVERPAPAKPVDAAPAPPKPAPQTAEKEGAGVKGAATDKTGDGAKGTAAKTTGVPKKGVPIKGGDIRSRVAGKTFHLEIGKLSIAGSNRFLDTTIELRPDGTTEVEATQYFFQTGHSEYSSTRRLSGDGKWWVEGNRWCHSSSALFYGARDCFDITQEGVIVRLYFGECTWQSSSLCRPGALAARGTVK